ncbi:hypothetical protein ENBRE01_1138 [Enteropsectra breve]|nr:hypothetical protein ENBRE01_1138 [Enteropsectra breve]
MVFGFLTPTTMQSKYEDELLKKLEAFKNCAEWSDFIMHLENLIDVMNKYSTMEYVPHLPLLVKRLNQCLNSVLPAGVHLKAFDVYTVIFNKLNNHNSSEYYLLLTAGLFAFGLNCRILVVQEYLSLIETHLIPAAPRIQGVCQNLLQALMPHLESESSDFYSRAYQIINSLTEIYSQYDFYISLFRLFSKEEELRQPIINWLLKNAIPACIPSAVLAHSYCTGIKSENLFVVRSTIDLSSKDFPFTKERKNQVVENISALTISAATTVRNDTIATESTNENTVMNNSINDTVLSSINTIATESTNENTVMSLDPTGNSNGMCELSSARLSKNVLKLLLKKEASFYKKVLKWFEITENSSSETKKVLESALYTFISEETDPLGLEMYYKILYILFSYEYSVINIHAMYFIRSTTLLINILKSNENSKCRKQFLLFGEDEIFKNFYLKISEAIEERNANPDEITYTDPVDSVVLLLLDVFSYYPTLLESSKSIHLLSLGILLTKNKKSISPEIFCTYIKIMIDATNIEEDNSGKESPIASDASDNKSDVNSGDEEKADVVYDEHRYNEGLDASNETYFEYTRDRIAIKKDLFAHEDILQCISSIYASEAYDDLNSNDLLVAFIKFFSYSFVFEGNCLPMEFLYSQVEDCNNKISEELMMSPSHADCLILTEIVVKYGHDVLPSDFHIIIFEFLYRHYQYRCALEFMPADMPTLFRNIWKDYTEACENQLSSKLASKLDYKQESKLDSNLDYKQESNIEQTAFNNIESLNDNGSSLCDKHLEALGLQTGGMYGPDDICAKYILEYRVEKPLIAELANLNNSTMPLSRNPLYDIFVNLFRVFLARNKYFNFIYALTGKIGMSTELQEILINAEDPSHIMSDMVHVLEDEMCLDENSLNISPDYNRIKTIISIVNVMMHNSTVLVNMENILNMENMKNNEPIAAGHPPQTKCFAEIRTGLLELLSRFMAQYPDLNSDETSIANKLIEEIAYMALKIVDVINSRFPVDEKYKEAIKPYVSLNSKNYKVIKHSIRLYHYDVEFLITNYMGYHREVFMMLKGCDVEAEFYSCLIKHFADENSNSLDILASAYEYVKLLKKVDLNLYYNALLNKFYKNCNLDSFIEKLWSEGSDIFITEMIRIYTDDNTNTVADPKIIVGSNATAASNIIEFYFSAIGDKQSMIRKLFKLLYYGNNAVKKIYNARYNDGADTQSLVLLKNAEAAHNINEIKNSIMDILCTLKNSLNPDSQHSIVMEERALFKEKINSNFFDYHPSKLLLSLLGTEPGYLEMIDDILMGIDKEINIKIEEMKRYDRDEALGKLYGLPNTELSSEIERVLSTEPESGHFYMIENIQNKGPTKILYSNLYNLDKINADIHRLVHILFRLIGHSNSNDKTAWLYKTVVLNLYNIPNCEYYALLIFYGLIQRNKTSKIFLDGLFVCFNTLFFKNGISDDLSSLAAVSTASSKPNNNGINNSNNGINNRLDKNVVRLKMNCIKFIIANTSYDSTPIINNLFYNLESKYFFNNNIRIKVANVKKLAFLLFANDKAFYSNRVDDIIVHINSMLMFRTPDKIYKALLANLWNLSSVMILRMDGQYTGHLYPIVLEGVLGHLQILSRSIIGDAGRHNVASKDISNSNNDNINGNINGINGNDIINGNKQGPSNEINNKASDIPYKESENRAAVTKCESTASDVYDLKLIISIVFFIDICLFENDRNFDFSFVIMREGEFKNKLREFIVSKIDNPELVDSIKIENISNNESNNESNSDSINNIGNSSSENINSSEDTNESHNMLIEKSVVYRNILNVLHNKNKNYFNIFREGNSWLDILVWIENADEVYSVVRGHFGEKDYTAVEDGFHAQFR